ncbi:hypothetical protein [Rahnella perminowiae]|uniref:hypothetical protein n=1 Tax=Rahnella perminowiae TaxID=2816244 RepID=UPI00215B8704|nr:hypothetical protein [Rahnella perminowiae]MCR8999600.1 hypothetical protein [Rahnella perminowiae]
MRWLRAFTRITDSCQLIGIFLLAAFLQLESLGQILLGQILDPNGHIVDLRVR